MLNHFAVNPRDKRPRVANVEALVDDDNEDILLVDSENAGTSTQPDFVPITGGQEQWSHYDLTSGNMKTGFDGTCNYCKTSYKALTPQRALLHLIGSTRAGGIKLCTKVSHVPVRNRLFPPSFAFFSFYGILLCLYNTNSLQHRCPQQFV